MRATGILLHVSSLPGGAGIGSMGEAAYRFVDFLHKGGFRYWQVLPLNTTSYGDSPYQSPSAFAGNPYFIDLETLQRQGLLGELTLTETGNVNYETLFRERYVVLRSAFEVFKQNPPPAFKKFCKQTAWWLDDYALFMAVKESYNMQSWECWSDDHRRRRGDFSSFGAAAEFYKFLQFQFFAQWKKLKAYANKKGIGIIGDMPIYVAYDSADVWARPELFMLDRKLLPKEVAGVPPDLFSATGQLWGNPLYNWKRMEADGFDWWTRRIGAAMECYDMVRIDHFRGFEKFFAIPYGMPDARIGKWRKAAGSRLFDAVSSKVRANIIAEDLGLITPAVRRLVRYCGYPNMKVLHFAFDGNPKNEFLPANYKPNCVAYTGTHDNDTTLSWYASLGENQKRMVDALLAPQGGDIAGACIEALLASKAETVVLPMQDILRLGGEARMNIPSTPSGNWVWRLKNIDLGLAPALKMLNEKYGRVPLPEK